MSWKRALRCRYDIVEISSGFVTLSVDDLVDLTREVSAAGLKAKPEVGIQFGAGGASSIEALEAAGTRDVGYASQLASGSPWRSE
jgi:phosphosulfolactate synthase (CoM biosynthesis protein A)